MINDNYASFVEFTRSIAVLAVGRWVATMSTSTPNGSYVDKETEPCLVA